MDKKKIKKAVRDLLVGIGEDPARPGLQRTPERIAEMCEEILGGLKIKAESQIKLFHNTGFDEIVLVKDIPFYSICEHHLLPFIGKAHIAYIPRGGQITGLSNLVKVVRVLASRLQLQERLTTEIADVLVRSLTPRGVLVQIEAEHLCMSMRGVKTPGLLVKTEALRGNFRKDPRTRAEALSLIQSS